MGLTDHNKPAGKLHVLPFFVQKYGIYEGGPVSRVVEVQCCTSWGGGGNASAIS